MSECEIAVIGAGPYGLSVAAHLSDRDLRVFGRPMSFWNDHMPKGMFLRSPRGASNLSAPAAGFDLESFEAEEDLAPEKPLPLATFVRYGRWFQRRAVPDVDERTVRSVDLRGGGFELTLEDGERVEARRVVVAAGIERFARRPELLSALGPERVSHAVEHEDLARFAGRRVAVIGAGQSATESAALLAEAGAEVELIARTDHINWLVRSASLHRLRAFKPLLYGPSDIGPAGLSWLVEWPNVFRRIPRPRQDRWAARAIRPAASAWLQPRVGGVRFTMGRTVKEATEAADGVVMRLDDGSSRTVDHVLLGTGYRIDLGRYGFLSPAVLDAVQRVDGYPLLGRGFESTLPGLHVVGAPAAWSWGPLFRFVAGAGYAAARVRRAVAVGRPRSRSASLVKGAA
jgi:hypothetical protein